MIKKTLLGLIAMAGILVPAAVQATIIPWSASLNGAQEVPASGSLGSGSAFGTIDDASGALAWNITFSGLSGPLIGIHFHGPAAPGVNAGVRVNIGTISGCLLYTSRSPAYRPVRPARRRSAAGSRPLRTRRAADL